MRFFDDTGSRRGNQAFGDVVCSGAEVTAAGVAMAALHSTMTAAPAAVQSQFKAASNAILLQWNQLQQDYQSRTAVTKALLFCDFKTVGAAAQALTPQIAAAASAAGTPIAVGPNNPALQPGPAGQIPQALADALKALTGIAVVGVALVVAAELLPPLLAARSASRTRKARR